MPKRSASTRRPPVAILAVLALLLAAGAYLLSRTQPGDPAPRDPIMPRDGQRDDVMPVRKTAEAKSGRKKDDPIDGQWHTEQSDREHDVVMLARSTEGPKSWRKKDDPTNDGWYTEQFNQRAKAQLKKLGGLLTDGIAIDPATVADLAAEQFACGPLAPPKLQTVFLDEAVHVERAAAKAENTSPQYEGPVGFARALQELAAPFRHAHDARFEFKIFRIDVADDSASTLQYFSISGQTAEGVLEQHATWAAEWTLGDPSVSPKLASIKVLDSLVNWEQLYLRSGNRSTGAADVG